MGSIEGMCQLWNLCNWHISMSLMSNYFCFDMSWNAMLERVTANSCHSCQNLIYLSFFEIEGDFLVLDKCHSQDFLVEETTHG